ncbi:MAG TPA: TolC family protein [Bryobacteraceae bacterium]|nr:TolC family protein [Bryobacteraceae bacterium]
MRVVWLLLLAVPLGLAQDEVSGRAPLQLSLQRAVEIAISSEGSTQVQLAGEALKQAQSRSLEARAALLPDLEASISRENQTRNLAALGIGFINPIPGFEFPTFVGPFTTMDARVTVSQNVFDFGSIRRYQASKAGISAAKSDVDSSQEKVAAIVARAYLAAIRADTDVDTAQANVKLSQAMMQLAQHQKQAGTGTGIEITRAQVQLANDQQQLLVAQNARRRSHLELLRAMNARLDTELELTDKLGYVPVDPVTLEQARAQALKERPDYQAQRERESNAQISANAVKMERLPSLVAFGDYGSIGTGFNNALPTRTYGLSLRVPIFDGGRRDARRKEAESQYRAESLRTGDLKEQIELDIRLALDSLHSADDEVKVASDGLHLAENELAQARRRYQAGVTDSLEVTDAQTRLERARDNQTAALYNYNVARIDLAQAMGTTRRAIQ